MTKIGIASDHAGYEMKEFLVGYLSAMGYDVHDFGPGSPERRATLQRELGLPARLTANGLLEALDLLLTREEFDAL